MSKDIISSQNTLIQRLDGSDFDLLRPALERVPLALRETLEAPNQKPEHIYFIETGMASVVALPHGELQTEVGLIGREGMTGAALALGDEETPFECYVQMEGTALRIEYDVFLHAFEQSPSLRRLIRLYARASSIQTAFTALANAQFKLDERLARWLLMVHDRVLQDTFSVTHEFLSIMLGVRRSGVNDIIPALEQAGLVRSRDFQMTILDRKGLEDRAGQSYGHTEREYSRLLK